MPTYNQPFSPDLDDKIKQAVDCQRQKRKRDNINKIDMVVIIVEENVDKYIESCRKDSKEKAKS